MRRIVTDVVQVNEGATILALAKMSQRWKGVLETQWSVHASVHS